MTYNRREIRELLNDTFSDEELRQLCYDIPEFRPVYDQFSAGMSKTQMVGRLIEYAERKMLMDILLEMVKEGAPERYEADQDSLIDQAAKTATIRKWLTIALIDFTCQELSQLCADQFPTIFAQVQPTCAKQTEKTDKASLKESLLQAIEYGEVSLNQIEQLLDSALTMVQKRSSRTYRSTYRNYEDQIQTELNQLRLDSPPDEISERKGRLEDLQEDGAAQDDVGRGAFRLGASKPKLLTNPIRNRWALLVGINKFIDSTFTKLNFCVSDVLALEKQLETLDYTVVTLHDDSTEESRLPTRTNIKAELTRLCQAVREDDLLLVHFASHGTLVDNKPVIITKDTRRSILAETSLSLAEVKQLMKSSRARRLILLLDACHTGVDIGRDLANPEFIHNAHELAEGFVVFAASTSQQLAQEWKEKKHGVFTYYLLEGLEGQADHHDKNYVTVDDLKDFVLDHLRRWYVKNDGLIQEPTIEIEGLGSIILADYRNSPNKGDNQ